MAGSRCFDGFKPNYIDRLLTPPPDDFLLSWSTSAMNQPPICFFGGDAVSNTIGLTRIRMMVFGTCTHWNHHGKIILAPAAIQMAWRTWE
ncbi:hypothetical protein PAXRUDRAFT_526864 [Paxillus rubicundulus Ve08.2h10]|uniref:Uncharacterized protein n=1 Tax=Paxillus rubicundulus Ve08.2h10 TaxID=930991 RepID=A0A0D0DW59_9AGAM|nr:hypothetical protein PAXRUDRAFT_526864 [Paxillus rubicundulus Ve08.2h10]